MTPSKPSDPILVLGVGMTPVGEHWEKSLRHLALDAIQLARADAGGLRPQALYVANMLSPALGGQSQLGALIADFAGLRGIEAVTVEAAGASGGMAVRQAYLALASGMIDVALVVGVEKVTDKSSSALADAMASAGDADHEAIHGATAAAQAALLMRRYLHETGAPAEALAGFAVTAHANAVGNPNAMFRKAIKREAYQRASMVCDPVGVFDAAPVADGAAALVLARASALPVAGEHRPVQILGSAAATSTLALHDRPQLLRLESAAEAVQRAYQQAAMRPEQMDLFELHDIFSIYAALQLEAAGFAEAGCGWKLAHDGAISLEGEIPILTFGGSKARGDTAGATGVYQLAELTLQLQERAATGQVRGAQTGLALCLGGSAATAAAHILGTAG